MTAQFDEDLYERFKESIKAVGQITPPIVYQVGEELILCDGLHRLEEAIKNEDRSVEVVVIPGDMIDVLTKNIFLDHLRGKTRVSEMVQVIKLLYSEYNLDPDQIKEKTGLPRDYIERLIKISQASPAVQVALDQGVIGVGHAFELSRLPYPIQQEEVIAKHQVWRFSIKELKEQIDMILQAMKEAAEQQPPGQGKTQRPPPVYNCEGCKEEIEPRYLRPVMLCPDCYGAVWRLGKAKAEAKAEASGKREGA